MSTLSHSGDDGGDSSTAFTGDVVLSHDWRSILDGDVRGPFSVRRGRAGVRVGGTHIPRKAGQALRQFRLAHEGEHQKMMRFLRKAPYPVVTVPTEQVCFSLWKEMVSLVYEAHV